MQKNTLKRVGTIVCSFLLTAGLVSCEKEGRKPKMQVDPVTTTTPTTTTSTTTSTPPTTPPSYSLNVNWDNRADGGYTYTQANQDFSNAIYWDAFSTQIVAGKLKATMKSYTVGPIGGAMSRMNVPDAATYQLQYDMMFDNNFDFSAGGKIGFGCLIGMGYTGGVPGTDGNGGSARLMWNRSSDGRVYLKPYIYHKDQSWQYGDDFGKSFPSSGSLQKGTWYNVKMFVKSNTGSNTDGRLQIVINGVTLIDQPMRWTTNDLERLIKTISFENFRGGSETYWQSATNGDIYFDNVSFTAL